MRTGSWQVGYRPTAFVLALVLATPIPWPRRLRAFLWALLAINAYVALRLVLTLLMGFSEEGTVTLFSLGPHTRKALEFIAGFVVLEFEGDLILPAAIWFLTMLLPVGGMMM